MAPLRWKGFHLWDGEKTYATVQAIGRKWFWYCGGIKPTSTFTKPVMTEKEAKKEAMNHIKKYKRMGR